MFYHWHECARCGAVTNKASHRRTPLSYSWEQEGDVWKATASCRCMLCHAQWSETVTATGTVTKQPTCTQNGETTYKASFELGGGFATKKVADIDPLGHSWDDNWEYYDAQQHVRHCTACGEPEYQDHNVSLRGAAEATCGKDGYTGDDYCTACGRTLSEGSVIPATGAHDYSAIHKTVQPTCTKNGYTVYKCANCGTVNPTHKEIVPALGHDYSVEHEKVDPTCTEDGYIVYECSRCGEVDPTQHVVEALGHDYSDVHRTVEPTCTKEGYTFYKCAHCGKVDPTHKDIVDPLGHDYSVVHEKAEPTCTEGGYTVYACSRCSEVDPTHKDIVDPLGHDYSVVHEKAEPTCTEGGYTVYACSRCSEVDPTHKEIVDPLGHAWGGWEIVRPATPTEKGEKKHTCTRCGVSETAEYEEQGELLLHSSADDQTGNALIVTVPYARRGSTATQLTANASVTYTSSDPKLLAVDANGKVTFSQLNIFRKSATVTAVTPDGRTASCEVRISLKWWHYIVWFLLGFLWY